MWIRWNWFLLVHLAVIAGLCFATLCFRPLRVAAQDGTTSPPTVAPPALEWISWGGMTTSADRDGTSLWLGGQGGAVRYDIASGEFQRFTVLDGLPQNRVDAVAGDDQGNLWFGGDAGLTQRDAGGAWHHFSTANSGLTSNAIADVAVANDGTVWALHGGGSISRRSTDNSWSWRPNRTAAVAQDYANAITTLGATSLWSVTGGDIWVDYAVYDGVTWYDRTPSTSYGPAALPEQMLVDGQGTVWALVDGYLLLEWDGQAWAEHDLHIPIDGTVDAIGIDSQDRLWIGGQGRNNPYVSPSAVVAEYAPELAFEYLPQRDAHPPVVALVPGITGVFVVGDGWLRSPDGAIVRFGAQPHYRTLSHAALDGLDRLFIFSYTTAVYGNGAIQRLDDRGTKDLADDEWLNIFDGITVSHMERGAVDDAWVSSFGNGRVDWPLAPRRVLADDSWIEYPLPMDLQAFTGDIFVRDARRACLVYANSQEIFPPELRSGIYCVDDSGTPADTGDDSWIDYPGPMQLAGTTAWDARDRLWYGDVLGLRRWDFGWDTIATGHVCELVPATDGTMLSIESSSGDCQDPPTIRIIWPNRDVEIDSVAELMARHADIVRKTSRANHLWSVAPDGVIWYLDRVFLSGAESYVLHRREKDIDVVYALPDSGKYAYGILTDATGRIWLATDEALWRGSAAPGFVLQAYPNRVWVVRGGQAIAQLGVLRTGEFTGTVTLAVTGLPMGVDVALSPNPVTNQQMATVAVDVDAGVASGMYTGNVTGQSDSLTAGTMLTITVVDRLFQDFLPRIVQP